ncbi:ig-like domain-containing protein [Trichonephila clavipes]|nr:ig-like domain-containing protein [Trichonephila clavipes]
MSSLGFKPRPYEEKNVHKIGVVGSSVDLPCDVDVSNCGKVYFITWTKNVSNEWKRLYLYSDAVEKPLQELANPDRADFFLQESTAYLRISPLRIEDDGTYKCDVTYVQGKCPSLSFATLTTYDSDEDIILSESDCEESEESADEIDNAL